MILKYALNTQFLTSDIIKIKDLNLRMSNGSWQNVAKLSNSKDNTQKTLRNVQSLTLMRGHNIAHAVKEIHTFNFSHI